MRDSFIFYRSFYEASRSLNTKQQAELFKAICEYSLNKEEVKLSNITDAFFTLIKPQLEANYKRYENGKKPKHFKNQEKANDKQTTSKTEANNNENENNNLNENLNENDIYNKKDFEEDSVEFQLSKLLFDLILERNPKHKEPNLESWAKQIDLMLRVDKRKAEEIEGAIYWCQQDEFWQNNILSTAKLRKQFDTLYLKAKNATPKQNTTIITESELREHSELILNDDRYK